MDKTCVTKWGINICQKTPEREIANIDIRIPNYINDTVFPSIVNFTIGNMNLWGGNFTDSRYSELTRNLGVTGVTGVGWYMYVTRGTPAKFNIVTNQIPYNTSILFATR